jgi:uncharacterized SAM-binding protein YcdF (DUF218 family)
VTINKRQVCEIIYNGKLALQLEQTLEISVATLFFIISKIIWALIRPETLLVLLFALGTLFHRIRRPKLSFRLLASATFLTAMIAIFPVGDAFLTPLERKYPANPDIDNVAGIIVLGGGEEDIQSAASGLPMTGEAGERFLAALTLAHELPDAIVLFTGGSGRLLGGRSGADIAEDIFLGAGLPKRRLTLERASRNTAENATMSLGLLPDDLAGNWLLVTSAFHMPRAVSSFCAAGWKDIVPWPTDYRAGGFTDRIGWNLADNLQDLNVGVREWIGLMAYRVTRKSVDVLEESDCLAISK